MTHNGDDRYLRQTHAFPPERRESSAVAVCGAWSDAAAGMAVLAGAAAMGVPVVGSDFVGPPPGGHWLTGPYPQMVAKINAAVHYEYLDREAPAMDLPYLIEARPNAWVAVLLNHPPRARDVLAALAEADVAAGVLLVLTAPGGLVVGRYPDPAAAIECVQSVAPDPIPAGPAELAVAAGGIVLNEVMLAGEAGDDLMMPRTVGFYSLHRPRRVTGGTGPIGELVSEVAAAPDGARAAFSGRKFTMVGAGALGNWTAIPLAMEAPAALVVHDGDPEVAYHNVNRQILLVDGVGLHRAKADVLVDQLRLLDPYGSYEAIAQFVKAPGDLTGLEDTDALLCLPDNDDARIVCDEARLRSGVLFATAATSATGGQAVVRCRWQGCLRCLGVGRAAGEADEAPQSCSLVQNDAVVSSNMVAAGLMLSELREALACRPPANVRFVGDGAGGNRLVRMISGTRCPHTTWTRPVGNVTHEGFKR